MGIIIVGVHHVQTTTTVLHNKDLSYCVKGCFFCSAFFEAETKFKNQVQPSHIPSDERKEIILTCLMMDSKKLFLLGLLLIASLISHATAMPNFRSFRIRRSPQGPTSPWCNSPFLNYSKFRPRFCPPNPLCKLTIGREERDCSEFLWLLKRNLQLQCINVLEPRLIDTIELSIFHIRNDDTPNHR